MYYYNSCIVYSKKKQLKWTLECFRPQIIFTHQHMYVCMHFSLSVSHERNRCGDTYTFVSNFILQHNTSIRVDRIQIHLQNFKWSICRNTTPSSFLFDSQWKYQSCIRGYWIQSQNYCYYFIQKFVFSNNIFVFIVILREQYTFVWQLSELKFCI